MKVICIGYYDKFSRFFIGVEKALQNKGFSTQFQILSIHFSGFLYTWLRKKSGFWLPLRAWRKAQNQRQHYLEVCRTQNDYHRIDFKSLIKFHQALNPSISTENLQLQALSYIDLFIEIFKTNTPDFVVLVGDSRLAVETCAAVAKRHGIPIFYIEQGPFNTTIFDIKGVNANAVFRTQIATLMTQATETASLNWLNTQTKKYRRSPFYRICDVILEKIQGKKASFPPDLIQTDVNIFKTKFKKQSTNSFQKTDKTVYLLILQVPFDVNMIYHSPYFSTHLELITKVYNNLPEDCELVIREHPVYRGMYATEMYQYIHKNNLISDNRSSLDEALSYADVVIVNNSTVGIQAISKHKKLVVLGNAVYDYEGVCLKHKGEKLNQLLRNALQFTVNKDSVQKFLSIFKQTSLIDGAITDQDLTASKGVANQLIKHYKRNT